ncbi:sugar phosphate isomerase/epimerase family protein [Paenibacillus aurantiacus]|uniref:Sugar phosphate isomerase/epimerase family protein n=1 Tax=Paenibacillus aurantiacus TaxID=1936118 RepID=A0ABV5KTV0_9BACL
MKIGYQTNTWGGVVGHPAGVTSVKDSYYLANGSTEQAIRDIAAAGYQGIELFDGNLVQYENRIDEFRRLLSDSGLALIGVYTGANFIYEDILPDEMAKIEKTAKLAAAAGAEHLVLGGGAVRAAGIRDEDFAALAKGLDSAAGIAKKYGLRASYHPHLGTMVERPDQLHRLMLLTDITLCPDTAHIEAGGGDPLEVIRKYGSRITTIHFKDYRSGAFVPLGEGGQPFADMLSLLREQGYDGWVTIELDSHDDPAKAASISRAYLRDTLHLR